MCAVLVINHYILEIFFNDLHPSISDCPGKVSQGLKDCDRPMHMRLFFKSRILFIFIFLPLVKKLQFLFSVNSLSCCFSWVCRCAESVLHLCLAMLVLVDHLRAWPYSQFVLALHWRAANLMSCCHRFSLWHTVEPSC